jgi:hypothetical protein
MKRRGEMIFVLVFTTVVMAVLSSWLMWARETGRTHLLWMFGIVLAFVIGRLWNYRPD